MQAVFEANLYAKAAVLSGIPVQMDVVDDPFPRIIVVVGDVGVPPLERGDG